MTALIRQRLTGYFDAAVRAAQPAICLPPNLPEPPQDGRLIILAAGKAAGAMAQTAEHHYLNDLGLEPDRIAGLAVTRHGYGKPTSQIRLVEAGHPVPDAAGVTATQDALALAASAASSDLILVLLSGGGSANWVAPAGDLTLSQKQDVTRQLLQCGATISEINTVRKHLSAIKGGRLAAIAKDVPILTLAISDVPHDDPATIASGPTVPDPSTLEEARELCAKYQMDLPPPAILLLQDPANETPKAGDPVFDNCSLVMIARPQLSIDAAAALARSDGYEVIDLGDSLEGEARDLAAQHARLAKQLADSGRKAVLMSGGEATVTLTGSGRGGPNQEYALAMALALAGDPRIAALAGDTDGTDGGKGLSSDPAGAICGPTTLLRAQQIGLQAAEFLANNDSTGFFDAIGDLLQPGPTYTNVNDFRAVIVDTEALSTS